MQIYAQRADINICVMLKGEAMEIGSCNSIENCFFVRQRDLLHKCIIFSALHSLKCSQAGAVGAPTAGGAGICL